MTPSAVLFDLDNTLHDRDLGLCNFVCAQHERLDLATQGAPLANWLQRFVELDDGGKTWKDAVYTILCAEFRLSNDPMAMLADYEAGFQTHIHPFEGLHETLEKLRSKGWLTGLITNGRSEFQRRTIESLRIAPQLDLILISAEIGLRKPDPAIFHLALRHLSCTPQTSWFIGDDPIADITGAQAAGMQTILFHPSGEPRSETNALVVSQLSQIVDIVSR